MRGTQEGSLLTETAESPVHLLVRNETLSTLGLRVPALFSRRYVLGVVITRACTSSLPRTRARKRDCQSPIRVIHDAHQWLDGRDAEIPDIARRIIVVL